MQESQVQFLDEEDPLEKEMATYFSIPALKPLGQRNLAGYSPMGCKSQTRLRDSTTITAIYMVNLL